MWNPIQIGDKVIVQKDNAYHVVEVQQSGFIVLEKIKIPISAIIGYPVGSTLYFDGIKVTQVEGGEIFLKEDNFDYSTDNRNLLDRSDNQGLTAEEIQNLKSAGSTGNAIITKLMEKSTTFRLKTKYSQEKYLNKKKKSYLCVFTVRPYNVRAISDMLSEQERYKSTSLRYDSLVQLLTYANVHAGSTTIVTDSYGGLVSKAILERLGPRSFGGRLISFFHGTSPPIVEIKPPENYSPIYNIQFSDVTSLLLTGSFARSHVEVEQDQMETIFPEFKRQRLEETCESTMSASMTEAPGQLETPSPRLAPRRGGKRAIEDDGDIDEEKAKLQQEKLKRLDEARKILCPSDEELSECLENRPDGLIVATRFYPVEITLLLMQFLPPGRPFVVHSHLLPPIVDLYNILKRRGSCIRLTLQDTWMRPMQVLSNRTHPKMRMNAGGGGFILSGYTVQRREDPDALLRQSTMRASTKQLFDEGHILHAQ